MIKVINFTIKIILSLLTMFIWWINIIIVLIMWDVKFMVAHTLLNLIWDKPKQCDIHSVVDSACICEDNAKGRAISGWCSKHKTDWT